MDLTIAMDVESNPGPNWTLDELSPNNQSQISSSSLISEITSSEAHYANSLRTCTARRFVYSRQELLLLNPFPLQSTPHVQPQGSHHCVAKRKYRGTRAGKKVRDKLRSIARKIPVIISRELNSNKRLLMVKSGISQLRTLTLVKIAKEPTAAKIVPRCMILNARSIIKPDAAPALYAELSNNIHICFISET